MQHDYEYSFSKCLFYSLDERERFVQDKLQSLIEEASKIRMAYYKIFIN